MKKPEFQCILKLCFDNDYDIDGITEVLGIIPQHTIRYSKSGNTKTTNIKRSGSWWYYFPSELEYKSGWCIQEVLEELFAPFTKEKVKKLKEVVQLNNGKVILSVNIYFQNDYLPEICIDGEVMRIIHDLDADIHININKDPEVDN